MSNEKPKRALAPVIDQANALDIPTTPVEDKEIHSLGWEEASNTLAVRFRDFKTGSPKSLYHYMNFGPTDWAAFRDAEVKGSHFREHVRPHQDRYPCFRIEEASE